MIKWKILSRGEYPRFYAWTLSVITSVLIRERLRESFDIEEGMVTTEARYYAIGFEDGRMDHSQGMHL